MSQAQVEAMLESRRRSAAYCASMKTLAAAHRGMTELLRTNVKVDGEGNAWLKAQDVLDLLNSLNPPENP